MPANDETRRLLTHVAARLGGVEKLAEKLQMSARVLKQYMTGTEPIPDGLLLRVVDLIMDEGAPNATKAATDPR